MGLTALNSKMKTERGCKAVIYEHVGAKNTGKEKTCLEQMISASERIRGT